MLSFYHIRQAPGTIFQCSASQEILDGAGGEAFLLMEFDAGGPLLDDIEGQFWARGLQRASEMNGAVLGARVQIAFKGDFAHANEAKPSRETGVLELGPVIEDAVASNNS